MKLGRKLTLTLWSPGEGYGHVPQPAARRRDLYQSEGLPERDGEVIAQRQPPHGGPLAGEAGPGTYTHARVQKHAHASMYTHANTHTNARTHTCAHTDAGASTLKDIDTHAQTHTQTHTDSHAPTLIDRCIYTFLEK